MPDENENAPVEDSHEILSVRYSLAEMMDEVAEERRESVFGRELVDASEIDKMFSKQRRRKKA